MKKTALLLAFLFISAFVFAQSITRKVIASAGGSYSSSSLQVGYTIGETVITTISSGNITLTQGFKNQSPAMLNLL